MVDSSGGGMTLSGGSATTVNGCTYVNSEYDDIRVNGAYLYGTGNILYGDTIHYTLWITNGSVDFHWNQIMNSLEYSVYVPWHYTPGVTMDLSNNYWGTTEADSVAAWIWDGDDDPDVPVTINYLPLTSGQEWSAVDGGPPAAPTALEVYPNPFNPQTTIRFRVSEPQRARVAVYDLTGRRIRTLFEGCASGERTVDWDGRDASGRAVSSGSYFVRMSGERVDEVRKITLVR